MIYLKTYAYSVHEFPFLKLNMMEAYPYIDKFIVCVFNKGHTGLDCDNTVLDELMENEFPEEYKDKLLYFKCDISDVGMVNAYTDVVRTHTVNEKIMRAYFTKLIELKPDDIVVSVDADEIIYGEAYPNIIEEVNKHGLIKLRLHQFFYKVNYHWIDCNFCSSIATKVNRIQPQYPNHWRDTGKIYDIIVGCHLSWCMTIDKMIDKGEKYSHPEMRRFIKPEILDEAIKRKQYPFDRSRSFNINVVNFSDNHILPRKMIELFCDFEYLIGT
jgi:hypothetical protein